MLFDFEGLTPHDRHKLLISTIVPRPIAWVTTLNADATVNVGPFSFFNMFCEDPPVICLGIGSGERGGDDDEKDTGVNIRRSGEFVVNLVGYDNAGPMVRTGVNYPPGVSELAQARLTPAPSARVKPPRIAESPASIECKLERIVDFPTRRLLVLGEVVAVHVRDDCVLDPAKCYIDARKLDLIGRMHGNGWYTRMSDWFQLPTPKA